MDGRNYTGKYLISCSYLYILNSCCRAMHFCGLNIFDLLCILPPQAVAQAKVKPKPAVFDSFGTWLWPGLWISKARAIKSQAKAVAFRPSWARTSLTHREVQNLMTDYRNPYKK